MIEYIYLVKCPDRTEEPFDFFDEAKDFAIGCLGSNPIITQIEVDRNDFGECIDSRDLGTIWSWEDMVKETETEPATSVFTKDDLADYVPETDPEFAALDDTLDAEVLDTIPDNFRKPIPDGMTIKDLVEEMEENEDTVECTWCEDLFDKSECRYEINLGWLCNRCQAAIMSRGETLTFRENSYWDFLDESQKNSIEEGYSWIKAGDRFSINTKDGLIHYLVTTTYDKETEKHLNKYDRYIQVTKENADGSFADPEDLEYDYLASLKNAGKLIFENISNRGSSNNSFLEELEDANVYRERLTLCPECGGATTFDNETGMCINCGFNTFSALTEDTDVAEQSIAEKVKESIKTLTSNYTDLPDFKNYISLASDVAKDIQKKYNISFYRDSEGYDKWWHAVATEVDNQLNQFYKSNPALINKKEFLNRKYELEYTDIEVTLQGNQRDADDWDEWTETVDYTYEVTNQDIIDYLGGLIQEEDVTDLEGGLEALAKLSDDDYLTYIMLNFYELTDKYEKELLAYWEDDATSAAQEHAYETYYWG